MHRHCGKQEIQLHVSASSFVDWLKQDKTNWQPEEHVLENKTYAAPEASLMRFRISATIRRAPAL